MCKGPEERTAAAAAAAKSLQSCPTLCNPIDSSPPGSPVPGILQARYTGVGCHFLLQEERTDIAYSRIRKGDFLSGAVAKTSCSQFRGPKFNP